MLTIKEISDYIEEQKAEAKATRMKEIVVKDKKNFLKSKTVAAMLTLLAAEAGTVLTLWGNGELTKTAVVGAVVTAGTALVGMYTRYLTGDLK